MKAFKSWLPLRPVCILCTSNVQTHDGEEEEHIEHEARKSDSYSSCDSFKTVSSTSHQISEKDDNTGTLSVTSELLREINTGLTVSQRADSSPGWPLLKSAPHLNKVPSPRSAAREMSVVEWALQLPDRRATTTGELPLKAEITQEGFNNTSEIQTSNERISIQKPSTDSGLPCNDESREEEHSLVKKLEQLCKGKTCKQFTYQELLSATSSFSAASLVGKGGCSRVYRGVLRGRQSVAVKLLNSSPEAEQELLLEVGITMSLQNKHIISLIGYCVEGQKCLLVYNFLIKGSLEESLHGGKDKSVLSWTQRLKVALGVAEALDYLHEGCSCPVIHRDVKSSNILLSDDFEPQLSDFGLAKWASTTSAHITCSDVVGTFGYLAPEYFMYGKVSEKTDVYSFGVVLLELITGRQPINTKNPKGQENLVMWARPLLGGGYLKELADPRLEDAYDANEMQRMMLSAALCIRQSSQLRPRMSRILKLLQGEGDDLTYWAKRQLAMSKELVDDEYGANYESHDMQTHLTLAMLGVADDVESVSSLDQSADLSHANRCWEDYLCGRYSRSSSFD